MTSSAAVGQETPCYSTRWNYGVHFCFNGPEIEDRLIGHFKHAFHKRGIKTTIDDLENTRGEEISQTTVKAIQESRSSIVVFCPQFAFNPRCLDELVTILDCKDRYEQLVQPLFFQIQPTVVRNMQECYAKAIAKHLEKFKNDVKVKKWELALHVAANLAGWPFMSGCESQLIQGMVEYISTNIHVPPCNADCLAGLQSRITEPQTLFVPGSCDDVDTVGDNGVEGRGNRYGTRHGMTHTQIRGWRSTHSKTPLGPLFACSHRKETENGGRFIMFQPSTGTSARPKQISAEIQFLLDSLNDATHSTENSTLSAVQGAGSVATRTSEEVKSAMQTLRPFVSKKFHELIPEGSEFLDYIEKIVLSFHADEKIPQGMVVVLEKIISCFSHWSQDYKAANTMLETKNADLLKIDLLQKEFEAVVIESKLAVSAENEVRIQLDHWLRKKAELEEELKAVTDEIDGLISSCEAVAVRKSSLLDKGTMLKTEKDNMEVRLPRIMGDRAAARFTQQYIEAEWSKLVKVFNEILVSEFGCR